MMKKSHVLIGTAAGVLALQGAPLELVIPGAALGSVLPDFDMQLGIPHRTITHWLVWPLVVLILPLGALFDALAIGWIMHILADCLTVWVAG